MRVLKPQDIVVLIKLHSSGRSDWSFRQLAPELRMSLATIHESLVNATAARLYDPESKLPIKRNLLEFLIYGVKYCFPAERGPMARGIPTSYAASPLVSHFPPGKDPVPVWPYAAGTARGIELQPIHQVVPYIALGDHRFGEIMALVDAIREGRPREVKTAVDELKRRFE